MILQWRGGAAQRAWGGTVGDGYEHISYMILE